MSAPADIPEILEGTDLADVVVQACLRHRWTVQTNDCFVLAQKVVSKAEGRSVPLDTVVPSAEAQALARTTRKDARLCELVLRESIRVVRAVPGLLIAQHRLGHIFANAGIDQSNVPSRDGRECALLLPSDPDGSARRIALRIGELCGAAVSVLINDSFGRPWREGVVGTAIGVYGLPAVVDRRGALDREGRSLQVTMIAHADEVAASASLLMGQADEGRPLVCLRGLAHNPACDGMAAIHRPAHMDLFK